MSKARPPSLSLVVAAAAVVGAWACGDDDGAPLQAIELSAETIRTWEERGRQFVLLEGNCRIAQGGRSVRCAECLAWAPAQRGGTGENVELQFLARRQVEVERPGQEKQEPDEYSAKWSTANGFVAKATKQVDQAPAVEHALFQHAAGTRNLFGDEPNKDVEVQLTVYQPPFMGNPVPIAPRPPVGNQSGPRPATPTANRNVRRLLSLAPRSSRGHQLENMSGAPGEELWTITGGVTLSIEEPDTGNTVTIATDRAVVWRRGEAAAIPGDARQDVSSQQIECYLEGNVQINMGTTTNFARNQQIQLNGKQVYFDVNRNRALVLDGTVETYDDRLQAPLLMDSERLFMFTPDKFYGEASSFTTSPYRGRPGYAFTASETYLERVKQPVINPFTGAQAANSQGEPLVRNKNFGTSYNGFLRLDDVPIFYLPYLRADLEHPLGPIETMRYGNTQRLGVIASVTLNAWRLFGLDYLEIADRCEWLFDVGYYSARGPAGGTRVTYFGGDAPGTPGSYSGRFLTWWIDDGGEDFLGVDRNGLVPPKSFRGRTLFQHRQDLDEDTSLIASFAYLSDQNFLQSFFQTDYDIGPDQETVLYLKRQRANFAWTLTAMPRVVDFLPQNEALPRADLYLIGQSLLRDYLTYNSRSSIGYFRVRPPSDHPLLGSPTFDAAVETARVDTRHELSLPLKLGDFNFVPYGVGQFTGYSEAINGDMLGRGYGASGVRASLPFWRIFPNIQSQWLNLNGMAHKITVYADYQYAVSSHRRDVSPYIDQLDDDASDLVRRMNLFRTYIASGLPIPARYDPRFEGLRRDLDHYPEVVDSLHVARVGVSQRLQTKRGPIGAERIIDWMTYDIRGSYFLDADRDNFGKPIGLIDYSYRWHLGDRTSVLSNGAWEPLDNTTIYNISLAMQRPPRSTIAAFYSRSSSGPFASDFVGFNASYRFSYKYAGYTAASVDVNQLEQLSYDVGFTRVGLDFIVNATLNYTAGRDDLGFRFEILPRIAPRRSFGRGLLSTLPYGVDSTDPIVAPSIDRIGVMPIAAPQPF